MTCQAVVQTAYKWMKDLRYWLIAFTSNWSIFITGMRLGWSHVVDKSILIDIKWKSRWKSRCQWSRWRGGISISFTWGLIRSVYCGCVLGLRLPTGRVLVARWANMINKSRLVSKWPMAAWKGTTQLLGVMPGVFTYCFGRHSSADSDLNSKWFPGCFAMWKTLQ